MQDKSPFQLEQKLILEYLDPMFGIPYGLIEAVVVDITDRFVYVADITDNNRRVFKIKKMTHEVVTKNSVFAYKVWINVKDYEDKIKYREAKQVLQNEIKDYILSSKRDNRELEFIRDRIKQLEEGLIFDN